MFDPSEPLLEKIASSSRVYIWWGRDAGSYEKDVWVRLKDKLSLENVIYFEVYSQSDWNSIVTLLKNIGFIGSGSGGHALSRVFIWWLPE